MPRPGACVAPARRRKLGRECWHAQAARIGLSHGEFPMKRRNVLKTVCGIAAICIASAASAQTFKTLVNFHGSNGDFPLFYGSLVQGTDGNMYGTTLIGGATTPSGTLTSNVPFRV